MTIAYDGDNRQVTIQDGPTRVTFTFDNNGNTTSENRGGVITNYEYNRRNRLKSIGPALGTPADFEHMKYNGDGLRRTKEKDLAVTTYVWDGSEYLGEIN